jgi:tripartite ATP-independent transporter DctP family solute receptor
MSISHVYNPDPTTSGIVAGLHYFKRKVELVTNGDIKVKLYPNSQLGSEVETAGELKDGALVQSSLISTGAMASFLKKYQLMDTPFLFPNYETAWAFVDSQWFANFMKPVQKKGMRYLGTFDDGGGFVAITNNKHLIKNLSDLKGLNIRTEENPGDIEIMKSLGASATPLPWAQVQTALASGLMDGQFNALGSVINSKIWSVTDYITLTDHVYNTVTWLVSDKWFSSLPKKFQKIIVEKAQEAVIVGHGVDARVATLGWKKACEKFKKCYVLPKAKREKWQKIARPAFKKWVTSNFGIKKSVANKFWDRVEKVTKQMNERNEDLMK